MGAEWSLTDWCDTWLKSSGINILDPLIELNPDGSLKSLKLKQTCGLRGQNRLRKHKLNIAIYEKGFTAGDEPFVLENIVVSDSEEITEVDTGKLPGDFVFGAINVNHGEHAYCKVRYDAGSVDWFKENLHQVSHSLTRAAVWRNLWILMLDKQVTSLQYMEFVKKQLVLEPVE